MENTAYAICSVNFDYNDEQYTQNGLSGVIKAYKTKEAAIAEVGRASISQFEFDKVTEYFEEELYNFRYKNFANKYVKDHCSEQCQIIGDLIDQGVYDNRAEIQKEFAKLLTMLPDYEAGIFLTEMGLAFFVIRELELV
jgi:hypothetical protein